MATALERLKQDFGGVLQAFGELVKAHNGLVTDHNNLAHWQNLNSIKLHKHYEQLEAWVMLPWYRRIFTKYPLKPKPITEEKSNVEEKQTDESNGHGPEISGGIGREDAGGSAGDQGGQNQSVPSGESSEVLSKRSPEKPIPDLKGGLPEAVRERIIYPEMREK
jgi:hypothetical protein